MLEATFELAKRKLEKTKEIPDPSVLLFLSLDRPSYDTLLLFTTSDSQQRLKWSLNATFDGFVSNHRARKCFLAATQNSSAPKAN